MKPFIQHLRPLPRCSRQLSASRLLSFSTTLLLGALLLACVAGCSGPVEVEADLREINVNIEEAVVRGYSPQIYVHPKDAPQRELTALMMPFYMLQSMENPFHYGKEVSKIFWQTFLQDEVFKTIEFMDTPAWPGQKAGIAQARSMGADLVIGGEITNFLSGGDLGDSEMAVRLKIYDAHSGALIWSISHAGRLNQRGYQDYLFFRKTSKLPYEPMYAISLALAHDMAQPINDWMEKFREKDRERKEAEQEAREAQKNQSE